MADMYVKLNTARSYMYSVARAMDNGHFASMVSMFLKINVAVFFYLCAVYSEQQVLREL